jgi:ribosomal protein L11 methyltransferase
MNYIELDCKISPYNAEIAEILTAELSELGYESFVETETGLLAYIQEDIFKEETLPSIGIVSNPDFDITFTHKTIEQENWNETWEKNYFEPIIIENQCVIRSSFHKEFPEIDYQITIDPKMAFGTGHHETTSLMIKEILQLELERKSVLDMGCGTGVLAILSAMKGAVDITAIDIDEWSYNNTLENMELNSIKGIKVKHGDVSAIDERNYDIFFANINKNVLLKDIPTYAKYMEKNALLLLSGFYNSDIEDISSVAESNGFELVKKDEKNNWTMLKYLKK